MKINILGTEYKIIESEENDMLGDDLGVCDLWDNKIMLHKDLDEKTDPKQSDRIDLCKAKVLRHELLHAIFKESGHWEYTHDEELIDIISLLYPKMKKIFKELNIEE